MQTVRQTVGSVRVCEIFILTRAVWFLVYLYSYFIQHSILYGTVFNNSYYSRTFGLSQQHKSQSKTTDTLLARWLSETHRETLSAQRAAATRWLRADVKLVTCAQLSEAGS